MTKKTIKKTDINSFGINTCASVGYTTHNAGIDFRRKKGAGIITLDKGLKTVVDSVFAGGNYKAKQTFNPGYSTEQTTVFSYIGSIPEIERLEVKIITHAEGQGLETDYSTGIILLTPIQPAKRFRETCEMIQTLGDSAMLRYAQRVADPASIGSKNRIHNLLMEYFDKNLAGMEAPSNISECDGMND